jgi:hypothetical protein
MPRVSIMTSTATPWRGGEGKPKNGGYDDWQLEDAERTLDRADDIRKDAKLCEAIAKHAEGRSKSYHALAGRAAGYHKAGKISDKALARVVEKRRGRRDVAEKAER